MNAASLVPAIGTGAAAAIVAVVTWFLNRGKTSADKAKAITEAGVLVLDQVQEERNRCADELRGERDALRVLRRDFRAVRNLVDVALDVLTRHGEDVSQQRTILSAIDDRH